MDRIVELRKLLEHYNYLYYVKNEPVITDQKFDELMHELERLEAEHPEMFDPNSPTQRVGNDTTNEFVQVAHKYGMMSLANTYSEQEIRDFDERVRKGIGGDEVVDELAKDPRVAAAYNLWYELREDMLRTYKDNLPERLPLSGQKEFKRIKNLVILEAVKLEQYQQVFHPDDLWDGNPDEHAEEAQLFVYEQMNQSMSHPPKP